MTRPGRLLLFWDYDTQWGSDADRARGLPVATGLGHLEFTTTERILALLARHELRACFAVVGAAAEPGERPYHDPHQVRRIHAAGHEVASHGYRHEWVPALGAHRLREVLRSSRAALESCIEAPVRTFVPPYNQPFDFLRRGAPSLSERRVPRTDRIDVPGLCLALAETGYRACRVAYRPLWRQLRDRLHGRHHDAPGRPETVGGVTCVRLNAPCGFDAPVLEMVNRASRHGGLVAAYAHPHSLDAGNSQDERCLAPFLRHVATLRDRGRLQVIRPMDLEER